MTKDGRISDAIGRKNTLVFASGTFFLGSLLCGAAPNFWSLVAARVVAGIGGGGLNTMSSIVTSDLVSLRDRGKYVQKAYSLVPLPFGLHCLVFCSLLKIYFVFTN
jgi:MFS family permease